MKLALIMNQNSYPGREFLYKLFLKNISVDVIEIGSYPEINISEQERCGGLWKPKSSQSLKLYFTFYHFKSLQSIELKTFLKKQEYDLCIQGGTGILNNNIISYFKIGVLNFHPGDLPHYRGCSAPEWQLWDNNPIVATCHLIDQGIDTGPILNKCKLNVNMNSYYSFRSSIYPEMAIFLVDTISSIMKTKNEEIKFEKQDESNAIYRSYIGDEKISILKKKLKN